jgi:hypothetical protein
MFKCLQVFLISLLSLFLFFPKICLAQTELTVTIRVGVTNLTLSGRISPNAQVTFIENGAVIGTTTANSSGLFSKTLEAMESGIHSIGIYATNSNSETTSTVNYSVSLTLGTETTLSNIILPPTIALSGEGIAKGDNLKISGSAVPSSTVTIFINGTSHSFSTSKTTTSASSGVWEYSYGTGDLSLGDYKVEAKTSTSDGYQSESSEIMNFKVQTVPTSTPAPGTTTTTAVSAPTSTPGPSFLPSLPVFINFFDIDGSGRIEIREIFNAAKLWVEQWRQRKTENCDLNRDKSCNLLDFSILLYYIGR